LTEIDGRNFENIRTWIVTAEDDQDQTIFVNGMKMVVNSEGIPDILSMDEKKTLPIQVPARSYAFFSFRAF